jgi:hypothetical protein
MTATARTIDRNRHRSHAAGVYRQQLRHKPPLRLYSFEGQLGTIIYTPAADRQGKLVLVHFWTYTCINWRRQLPYLFGTLSFGVKKECRHWRDANEAFEVCTSSTSVLAKPNFTPPQTITTSPLSFDCLARTKSSTKSKCFTWRRLGARKPLFFSPQLYRVVPKKPGTVGTLGLLIKSWRT